MNKLKEIGPKISITGKSLVITSYETIKSN